MPTPLPLDYEGKAKEYLLISVSPVPTFTLHM